MSSEVIQMQFLALIGTASLIKLIFQDIPVFIRS